MGMYGSFADAINSLGNAPQQNYEEEQDLSSAYQRVYYEPWRDAYKGLGFMDKRTHQAATIDYTYDDMGITYVVFKNSSQPVSISELQENFVEAKEYNDEQARLIYRNAMRSASKSNEGKEINLTEKPTTEMKVTKDGNVIEVPKSEEQIQQENFESKKENQIYTTETKTVKSSNNPIVDLLRKKKSKSSAELLLKLNIPNKELFDILNESFDNVLDGVVEYLFCEDNYDNFKNTIIESLKIYYEIKEEKEDE